MICPNCGKTSPFKTDNCEKCNYDFAEINANAKRCRLSLWAMIACLIVISGYIATILLGTISHSDSIRANTTKTINSILDTFAIILAVCLFTAPTLGIVSRIRISLAKGRLYGYRYATVVIILTTIVLIALSAGFSSMGNYFARGNTHRISRIFARTLEDYIEKHNGQLPSDENWIDDIDSKTLRDLPVTNIPTGTLLPHFAINSYVAGKMLSELPDDAVIAFETGKTLENKRVFSAGIKMPQDLEIDNSSYKACTILTKTDYGEFYLHDSDISPGELSTLNWMNTDELVLPDAVNKYLSDKAKSQFAADVIATVMSVVTLAGLVYFFTTGFGWRITLFVLASCLFGIFWGLQGLDFHNISTTWDNGLQGAYISAAPAAFIAVLFSFIVLKFKLMLPAGCLSKFISATATVAGILCSIIVHLLFMLINYQWAPLALLCGLGWGIVGGGIMAIIANGFVFRRMLKWEPVVGDAAGEQLNEV